MSASREDVSTAALLRLSADVKRRSRLTDVESLEVLLQWADIHSVDRPGGLRPYGGDGTPLVLDHCLGEIALARSSGAMATFNEIADALDLRHRLPLIWARTRAGAVDVWVVRKIARLTRKLPLERVGLVDAAIAPLLGHESAGRVLDVTEAKVIEADPVAHQERVETEKRRRYVGMSATDEHGMRTIIARIEAADAVWVDATISRVAEILAPQHPDASADELRARAFSYLARPAELFKLLLENVAPDDDLITDLVAGLDPPRSSNSPDSDDEPEPEPEPTDEDSSVLNKAIALPADLLARFDDIDLTKLRPKMVFYIHLHEAALHGVNAVARIEGLGPVTLAQLQTLLAGAEVHVKPVINLQDRVRTTAYEHPEALKERVHLISGGDYWPWATSTSRRVDYDHVRPYDKDGPPGQTGTHNSGPLGRRHHRWKTRAGYRATQLGPGSYLWTTPHGHHFLVDHHGSRYVDPAAATILTDAPAWVTEQELPPPTDPGPFWSDDFIAA